MGPTDTRDDAALVAAASGGSERAFGELFRAYAKPVFWIAHGLLGDAADAEDVTRALREIEAADPARPRAPVIMLSANAMIEHQEQAAQAGADLHLAKPVTAKALTDAVRRTLADRAIQPG